MVIEGLHYSPKCFCENCKEIERRNNISNYMTSLQKESEWEKEWSKKKNEILGLFNAGQHHLLTQNGSVNLTSSQQREEGEYNCRDAEKAVNRTEEFFLSVLSNREKEIAEEVEEIQTKLHNGHLEAGYKLTNKLLSILKH